MLLYTIKDQPINEDSVNQDYIMKSENTMNREYIINLLRTNDKAIARALVALNKNQTTDEQISGTTIIQNGKGFRPCHARMGTSMAEFYEKNCFLTPKQISYWRVRNSKGIPRIEIYANQLLGIARSNTQPKRQMSLDGE